MRLQCRILRNIAVSTGFLVWLLWLVWPAWSAATAAPRAQIVGRTAPRWRSSQAERSRWEAPKEPARTMSARFTRSFSPYYMDVFETTNRVYRRCVDAGACAPPEIRTLFDDPRLADHPVVIVDWEQAHKFCQWAGKRLPTEAGGEFAARGPDGRIYPWGNEWDPSRANWNGESEGGERPEQSRSGRTRPASARSAFTTWPETSGNGAPTGTMLNRTRATTIRPIQEGQGSAPSRSSAAAAGKGAARKPCGQRTASWTGRSKAYSLRLQMRGNPSRRPAAGPENASRPARPGRLLRRCSRVAARGPVKRKQDPRSIDSVQPFATINRAAHDALIRPRWHKGLR